jgi:hypothetical protein
MCAVCGWCLRACMCVAHVSTVVGVSRGVENHVLDEAIFCVQVRAAATALCVGMCVRAHVGVYGVCVCMSSARPPPPCICACACVCACVF